MIKNFISIIKKFKRMEFYSDGFSQTVNGLQFDEGFVEAPHEDTLGYSLSGNTICTWYCWRFDKVLPVLQENRRLNSFWCVFWIPKILKIEGDSEKSEYNWIDWRLLRKDPSIPGCADFQYLLCFCRMILWKNICGFSV